MNKQLIANIKSLSNLSEPFIQAVLNRLLSFGYQLKDEDAWMISFCCEKTENHIKNSCNIHSVPDGLFNVAVDMACGQFLLSKKQTGQLNIENLDFDAVVTSIKEGDTQVNFDSNSSDESKLNYLINYLLNSKEGDLICFRKIRW